MSTVTIEQVLKLARLSRLYLTEEEARTYQVELSHILSYIERLDAVDVSHLEPTYQVTGLANQMRADTVSDKNVHPDKLLEIVPDIKKSDGRFIKVKRMI
jgi:aspartyl-tRNA(Asn)/glutamyl-tRNA(Gln) amidotransferase subunit C